MELPDPPEGWRLTSLIDITYDKGPEWSAQFHNDTTGEHCHGVGTSPRYAMLVAHQRIEAGEVYARMSGGEFKAAKVDLASVLGIEAPKAVPHRRI